MADAEGGEDQSGDRVEERIVTMILRNLKILIRRYPVAVVLNFTGLVAALCALVVLSHYLRATRMNPAEVLKKD